MISMKASTVIKTVNAEEYDLADAGSELPVDCKEGQDK